MVRPCPNCEGTHYEKISDGEDLKEGFGEVLECTGCGLEVVYNKNYGDGKYHAFVGSLKEKLKK